MFTRCFSGKPSQNRPKQAKKGVFGPLRGNAENTRKTGLKQPKPLKKGLKNRCFGGSREPPPKHLFFEAFLRGFGCFRPVLAYFQGYSWRVQNTPFWPVFGCFRPNRFWTSKSQVSRTYHGQRFEGFWPLLGVPKTVPKRPKTGRNPQTFVQIMSLGPGSWEAYGAQHAKRAKARPGKTGVLPGPTIKIYRCQNRQNEGVFREGGPK